MSFQRFHDTWIEQFRHLVHQLNQAPRPHTTEEHYVYHHLRQLVSKVVSHCAEFYRVKSLVVKQDVLSFSAVPWITTLERSLHWIGGWRPTAAFHFCTPCRASFFIPVWWIFSRRYRLGDLSPGQFRRVSELQCETVHEESAITDELSVWQDSADDIVIVGLYGDFDEKMERLARILNAENYRDGGGAVDAATGGEVPGGGCRVVL